MGGIDRTGDWKKKAQLVGLGIGGLYGASKLYGLYKGYQITNEMKKLGAPLQMIY